MQTEELGVKKSIATEGNLAQITQSVIAADASLSSALAKNRAAMSAADNKVYTDLAKAMAVTKPISGDPAEIAEWSKSYNTGAQAMRHLADKYGFSYETAKTSAIKPTTTNKPVLTPAQRENYARIQYYKAHPNEAPAGYDTNTEEQEQE
jgi:hypothetical protein